MSYSRRHAMYSKDHKTQQQGIAAVLLIVPLENAVINLQSLCVWEGCHSSRASWGSSGWQVKHLQDHQNKCTISTSSTCSHWTIRTVDNPAVTTHHWSFLLRLRYWNSEQNESFSKIDVWEFRSAEIGSIRLCHCGWFTLNLVRWLSRTGSLYRQLQQLPIASAGQLKPMRETLTDLLVLGRRRKEWRDSERHNSLMWRSY